MSTNWLQLQHNEVVEKMVVNVRQSYPADLVHLKTSTSSYKYKNNSRWILSNQSYYARKESSREKKAIALSQTNTRKNRQTGRQTDKQTIRQTVRQTIR